MWCIYNTGRPERQSTKLHASYRSEPLMVSYNDYAADAAVVETGGGLPSHWIYHHFQYRSIVKVLHLTYYLAVVAAVVDAPQLMPAFRLQHLHWLRYPLVTLMKVVDAAGCDGDDQWIAVVVAVAAAANDVVADAYVLTVARLVVEVAVVLMLHRKNIHNYIKICINGPTSTFLLYNLHFIIK